MAYRQQIKSIFSLTDTKLIYIFGLGLFLFVVHNTALTLSSHGNVWLFMPQIGFMLMLGVITILWPKLDIKNEILSNKLISILLLLFLVNPLILLFIEPSLVNLARELFLMFLFVCYIIGKKYSIKLNNVFPVIVIIVSISVIIYNLFITNGNPTGGILSKINYDIVIGIMVISTFAYIGKYKSIIIYFMIAGLAFSNSPEGIIALVFFLLTMLIKRDFTKRSLFTLLALIIVVYMLAFLVSSDKSYLRIKGDIVNNPITNNDNLDGSWNYRIDSIKGTIENVSILGHGYNPLKYDPFTGRKTVHNVPLIILDQIGILPFLAWIFIMIYCFVKTKWKYLIIGIFSVCLFDHYIFTTMAPYWFVVIGIMIENPNIKDRIYANNK